MKVSLKDGPLDGKVVTVEHFSEILAEWNGIYLAYSPTGKKSESGYPQMQFSGRQDDD